jgi:hypothetical protein
MMLWKIIYSAFLAAIKMQCYHRKLITISYALNDLDQMDKLAMYYFALDFEVEMPYHLAPPQGWEAS